MRHRKAVIAALVLILSAATLRGTGESMGNRAENLTLTGTVRVVGNAPFTRVVLTVPSPDGSGRSADYLVTGPLASEMRSRYQLKTVTVEGRRCGKSDPDGLPCIEPKKILQVE